MYLGSELPKDDAARSLRVARSGWALNNSTRIGVIRFIALAGLFVGLTAGLTGMGGGARKPAGSVVVAAAGDIACDPVREPTDFNGGAGRGNECRHRATSDLLVGRKLDAVLVPGDTQYAAGTSSNFKRVYDPTWGRVKSITRPVPGNTEYNTPGAVGYYDYFGSLAGPRGKGFYSFNLGNWHLIGLNTECRAGCALEQEQWLRADLARNAKPCTLAYWHHPRFSSGRHGNILGVSGLWKTMYDNKVEVVLNGHDHDYERFAPMNASGAADPNGVREFVVGRGGKSFVPFAKVQPNSEVRDNSGTPLVLLLTLKPTGYDWKAQPIAGRTFSDTGSGTCH